MSKFIRDIFSIENIILEFVNKIRYNSSVGIDKVNSSSFENRLKVNAEIIRRKLDNDTYTFTPYKQILVSKGKNKCPRVISVPTVRDRIVLQIINRYLQSKYDKFGKFKLPQTIISELIFSLRNAEFDSYIKIDMSNFYGTINHQLLIQCLEKKRISKQIIKIIHDAINTPTVSPDSFREEREVMNVVGVPQGLSISNVLSSFFMIDFDRRYSKRKDIYYIRYVDDILILCKGVDSCAIKEEVCDYLISELLLKINIDKTCVGSINEGFTYLGYRLKDANLLPRKMAIRKLEKTIESLFIEYNKVPDKEKNYDYFVWQVNIKITGAIYERKKYGWLFYYSQISDESIFYHLDWFVIKMIKRFNIEVKEDGLKFKKFVRAHMELIKNLNNTSYIPNLSSYDPPMMEKFLIEIAKVDPGKDVNDIERRFNALVFKSLNKLEKDLQSFS